MPGVDLAWISDDMFEQKTYPDAVVVVGAGFIACEFASILRGLGLSVTMVVRGDHLLRGFDHELADAVLDAMRDSGIHVQFGVSVKAIDGDPGHLRVELTDGLTIPGGVLMATGRRPWLAGPVWSVRACIWRMAASPSMLISARMFPTSMPLGMSPIASISRLSHR